MVCPDDETFLVIGVIFRFNSGFPDANAGLLEVERDFIALAQAGGYRLYLQAENIGRAVDFASYYGDGV